MPNKHPLDPLTPDEITLAGSTILSHFLGKLRSPTALKVTYITLIEPPKVAVLDYLGISTGLESKTNGTTNGINGHGPSELARRAESTVIDALTGTAYTVKLVYAEDGKSAQVEDEEKLPEGLQPGITLEELCLAEEAIRKDERVIKLCADVGIEPSQIYSDGWSIGHDTRFGKNRRLQQCLMYARFGEHENLYAHPLDFSPVVDANANKVIHIDFAHRQDSDAPTQPFKPAPRPESTDADVTEGELARERIPPPLRKFDYLPDLLAKEPKSKFELRQDLKPLHVVQPEGVSFQLDGNRLKWQKWDLHIGFNYREGIVLNTVTYNDAGNVRPVLYRASLAEMVVPYSAPQWPHPRKHAFDVGEYGIGTLANSLALGCDCLGTIQYLDGVVAGQDGKPVVIPKAICIHEVDEGLLWKHTDFRVGGRSHAVRSRVLVISMICTVANYEYLFYWKFHQDGNITLEIKLSGILNLYILAQGEDPAPYGTEVAPQIVAHYHQHLFSLRLDPMIDGLLNSVMETDILTSPHKTGSPQNYAGNAFYTQKTILKTAEEGVRDADALKSRSWTIVNEGKKHYASGAPVGFKVMCKDLAPSLVQVDSIVATRAPFAKHAMWVTKHKEGRYWPAGKYVPQTTSTPEDSILNWTKEGGSIQNEDIVCYLTFGTTHIPRPEDFPVMPAETVSVMLKPIGFFDMNPALDVPALKDTVSKAVDGGKVVEKVKTNGVEGVNDVVKEHEKGTGTNGHACCH